MNNLSNNIPVLGEGATIQSWCDRTAYEVVQVSSDGLSCTIQQYADKPAPGYNYYGNQVHIFDELIPNSEIELIFKNGTWKQKFQEIVFIDSKIEFSERLRLNHANPEWFDSETFMLKLIPGISRIKKTTEKINVRFGIRGHYQNPSF